VPNKPSELPNGLNLAVATVSPKRFYKMWFASRLCQGIELCSVEWRNDKRTVNLKVCGRKTSWRSLGYYSGLFLAPSVTWKRWYRSTRLHGVTSKKTVIFALTLHNSSTLKMEATRSIETRVVWQTASDLVLHISNHSHLFHPEDGSTTFLRNEAACCHIPEDWYSHWPLWEPQMPQMRRVALGW
jgi:hypothetical protein